MLRKFATKAGRKVFTKPDFNKYNLTSKHTLGYWRRRVDPAHYSAVKEQLNVIDGTHTQLEATQNQWKHYNQALTGAIGAIGSMSKNTISQRYTLEITKLIPPKKSVSNRSVRSVSQFCLQSLDLPIV